MLRKKIMLGLVAGLVCWGVGGVLVVGQVQQGGSGSMQFEVVSIKANLTGRGWSSGMIRNGYQAEDISLLQWIVNTYGLRRDYQVLGLPEWAKSTHYDVAAKVSGPDVAAFQKLHYAQINRMFQPVLEDRFGLRSHWEKRILPTYTLTLAKKGSALKDGTDKDSKVVHVEGTEAYIGAGSIVTTHDGRVISQAAPIRMLVEILEGELNSIVVDETGLKGTYDYELHLPRASAPTASAVGIGSTEPMQPGDTVEGSLYQIGLRLVPSKTEQPVLVVDAIQQPSPN